MASSRLGWLDKPAMTIEDASVRDLLERVWRSRQAALEVGSDGNLSYVVPLRLYATQQDHTMLQDGLVLVQLNNHQMLHDALLSSLGLWGVLSILTLLLVGLMVGLLVRWVTRPIAQIEEAINARMQGSPVRVAPAKTRELARLADAYNDMLTAEQRANEQLYLIEKVFHNSQEGLIVTDANKVILMVNEAQCRMSGYQRTQMLGQPLVCCVHMCIRQIFIVTWPLVWKKAAHGRAKWWIDVLMATCLRSLCAFLRYAMRRGRLPII